VSKPRHLRPVTGVRRGWLIRHAALALTVAAVLGITPPAGVPDRINAVLFAAEPPVPVEFRGEWAAPGRCGSGVRMRVTDIQLILINGTDSAAYGDIAWPTTFFGPDYDGISRVAIPEFGSMESPFTVFFNADEKRGDAKVYIGPLNVLLGNAPYNRLTAANRALAARFPFGMAILRKCPAPRRNAR